MVKPKFKAIWNTHTHIRVISLLNPLQFKWNPNENTNTVTAWIRHDDSGEDERERALNE